MVLELRVHPVDQKQELYQHPTDSFNQESVSDAYIRLVLGDKSFLAGENATSASTYNDKTDGRDIFACRVVVFRVVVTGSVAIECRSC